MRPGNSTVDKKTKKATDASYFRTNEKIIVGEYSGLIWIGQGQKKLKKGYFVGTLPYVKNVDGKVYAATAYGKFIRRGLARLSILLLIIFR